MENNQINELEQINQNDWGTLAIDLGSSTTVVVFQQQNG